MLNRDEYVSLIKETFVSMGVSVLMKAAVTNIPFLAWPFFNPLTKMIVKWGVTELVTKGETAAFFLYIDMRVGNQSEAFEKAALAYHAATTPEEKVRLEKAFKAAFRDFARITT